jgi:hypothetical protein
MMPLARFEEACLDNTPVKYVGVQQKPDRCDHEGLAICELEEP